jgi:hypothetical protein
MNRIRANRIKAWPLLLLLAATTLWGQEGLWANGGSSWKGIEIRFATQVEPAGERRVKLPSAVVVESGRVHHLITDAAHKRYFAYDVVLEPNSDGTAAQIRIEPLHSSQEISAGHGNTLLALPNYPVIPNVKVGDTVALDLLANPATGQKIVDYLTLMRRATISDSAHDFRLADVQLTLGQPRMLVNGASANVPGPNYGVSGAVVWLYLTGHGRFVLSLFPNEKLGFQKSGVVSGDALSFRDGPVEYRVECSRAIVPGSGSYNLYVVHEAEWRPRGSEPFLIGSADKAEWVVGKH